MTFLPISWILFECLLCTRCLCVWRTQSLAEDINKWINRNTVLGSGNTLVTKHTSVKNRKDLRILPSLQANKLAWQYHECCQKTQNSWVRSKGLCYSCRSRQHTFHVHISFSCSPNLMGNCSKGPHGYYVHNCEFIFSTYWLNLTDLYFMSKLLVTLKCFELYYYL